MSIDPRKNEWIKVFVYNSLCFRQCTCSFKVQVISPCYTRHGMWSIFKHLRYTLHICLCIYVYRPSKLVYHIPTAIIQNHWHVICPVYIVHTISLSSSTMQNTVITCRTQKHYNFSAGIPAMQVHLLLNYLARYLVHNPCIFFLRTTSWRLNLICGPACNIAISLKHDISQLPGPTYPLLGRTPSIQRGTIDDRDVPSDIKLNLFYNLHYPQLVLPWVEVSFYNTSLVRRKISTGCIDIDTGKSSFMVFLLIS